MFGSFWYIIKYFVNSNLYKIALVFFVLVFIEDFPDYDNVMSLFFKHILKQKTFVISETFEFIVSPAAGSSILLTPLCEIQILLKRKILI